MNKKNLTVFISIFISILLILVVGYFLISGKKTKTTQQNTQNTPTSERTISWTAKEAYDQLYAEAKKWQEDARAYKMEGGDNRKNNNSYITADGKVSNWRIWFASPSQKEIRVYSFRNGAPYYYPEAGGGRFSYEVNGFANKWQIDSNKAVEIAEREGIIEVMLMHLYSKESLFVTVPREIKKASTPCEVWWDIWGKDQSGVTKTIYLDASSGEVLK